MHKISNLGGEKCTFAINFFSKCSLKKLDISCDHWSLSALLIMINSLQSSI